MTEGKDVNAVETVPYIVYESLETRSERAIHRLIKALVIVIALLFITNALWLYAWLQYDYVGTETNVITKDGETNFIGNDGTIGG